jgi:UDP-N-acetylmuramoylalanine--D-glutamate ligase
MNFIEKKIGIWGFGTVGHAALTFFAERGAQITIMDQKKPTQQDLFLIRHYKATFQGEDAVTDFFAINDYVLVSPGIDIRPHKKYRDKFLTELDLFFSYWNNPVIAITGSIGKTTLTTMISQLLSHYTSVATGGNIGVGMLDLIKQQSKKYAVLEVSSFQLEYASLCKPQIAIITNLYPNHYDRHESKESYAAAKANIYLHQTQNDSLILGAQTITSVTIRQLLETYTGKLTFVAQNETDLPLVSYPNATFFYFKHNAIVMRRENKESFVASLTVLPPFAHTNNWLYLYAVWHRLAIPMETIQTLADSIVLPEHRLEWVATVNGTIFYNDSKATIPQATMAALDQCKNPTILFLGGLSKGVDRSSLINYIAKKTVTHVACFGAEAAQLNQWCKNNSISSTAHATLEDAFSSVQALFKPDVTVLFSPSGSSYDLFQDYQERGKQFKKLVQEFAHKNTIIELPTSAKT